MPNNKRASGSKVNAIATLIKSKSMLTLEFKTAMANTILDMYFQGVEPELVQDLLCDIPRSDAESIMSLVNEIYNQRTTN